MSQPALFRLVEKVHKNIEDIAAPAVKAPVYQDVRSKANTTVEKGMIFVNCPELNLLTIPLL